jgi:FixJ family two-component response regulator
MRRAQIARLVLAAGHHAEIYETAQEMLAHAPSHGIVLAYDDIPKMPVAALIAMMMAQGHWLPVIAFAHEPETSQVVRAMTAGAFDYMPVPDQIAPLIDAISRVSHAADFQRALRLRGLDAQHRVARLSIREQQVLHCLAEGSSNKEIARALEISPRTVEIHRSKMMGKLGAHHVTEAVRLYLEAARLAAQLQQSHDVLELYQSSVARDKKGGADIRYAQFAHDAPTVHVDRTHA